MSLDRFLHAEYHRTHYNCGHFACDVYNHLTGNTIAVPTGCSNIRLRKFVKQLQEPINPCLVVMSRPNYTTHVGVYIDHKVMHLTSQGARIEPIDIASLFFTKVRFYTC
jgi:hypothetical protein